MMFYPGGGYPGLYFPTVSVTVRAEIFDFSVRILRVQDVTAAVSTVREVHTRAFAVSTTWLDVVIETGASIDFDVDVSIRPSYSVEVER